MRRRRREAAPGRGRCGACGAEVLWIRLDNGLLAALDPAAVRAYVLRTPEGMPMRPRLVDTYRPHVATCERLGADRVVAGEREED